MGMDQLSHAQPKRGRARLHSRDQWSRFDSAMIQSRISNMTTFVIEDEIHADWQGKFNSWEQALAELRRRASIPWDQSPNAAPCTSWRTCERKYSIIEFDDSQRPWKELRRVPALNVSVKGVEWAPGFAAIHLS
jgi:hypothetical protein